MGRLPASYAAAEPLLLAGYEGLKRREARMPPEARGRLTANAWRKKLPAQAPSPP